MCRNVLFPTPEAPRIATISPFATSRSQPRRTWRAPPGVKKSFTIPRIRTKPGSPPELLFVMPDRLDRIESRRPPRRHKGRGDRKEKDRRLDGGDVSRLNADRERVDEVDVTRQLDELVTLERPAEREPEDAPHHHSDRPDRDALRDEEPADPALGRAH